MFLADVSDGKYFSLRLYTFPLIQLTHSVIVEGCFACLGATHILLNIMFSLVQQNIANIASKIPPPEESSVTLNRLNG